MPGRTYSRAKAQSLKFVQVVFGCIAAFAVVMSLGFQLGMIGDTLPADDILTVTHAFLILGVVNTAMVFAWERLLPLDD